MAIEEVTAIDPNTGETFIIAIESDPILFDALPTEYQDEDGNWYFEDEEGEE
jgi:hypothetical protein